MNLTIRNAQIEDIRPLSLLLDAYRVFYSQKSDLAKVQAFIQDRLKNKDSHIFIAQVDQNIQGFTQLYPSFSSVSLERVYILNDLYVSPSFRGQRIGEALLKRAQVFAQEKKAKGLALETALDNPAQKLYEKLGWLQESDFLHYFWTVKNTF